MMTGDEPLAGATTSVVSIVAPRKNPNRSFRKVIPLVPAYLDLLREGKRRGQAAAEVGLDRSTIVDYRTADEEFRAAELEAEHDAHEQVEEALFQAAISGNTTAIQVWLYNRMPGDWADRRNFALTGKDGGPISVEVEHRIIEEPLTIRMAKTLTILDRANRLETSE